MSSTITHTGAGSVSNTNGLGYSFSFASIDPEDIQVEVIDSSNVRSTKSSSTPIGSENPSVINDYRIINYSAAGSSSAYILFESDTARGFTDTQDKVRVFRRTPSTSKVTFVAGSSITASDLNTQTKQALNLSEENRDSINSLAVGDGTANVIVNSSNIVDFSIRTIDIQNSAITHDKLKGAPDDSNNLLRAVDADNIRISAVTTSKIQDDAVTTDKLADSINTTIDNKADIGSELSIFNNNNTNYITLAQADAGLFATGMIMMFTGSTAPTGWVFCDNSAEAQAAGAPDLRDRFIVGAGNTYSSGATGGSADAVLVEHRHLPTTGGFSTTEATGTTIAVNNVDVGNYGVGSSGNGLGPLGNRHFMQSEGVSGTNKNLPPYYALAYIMKT